jgi:hypothetical protein
MAVISWVGRKNLPSRCRNPADPAPVPCRGIKRDGDPRAPRAIPPIESTITSVRAPPLLAVAIFGLLSGPAAAQDPSTKAGPPPGSAVDPALQKSVNAAIGKGVAALRTLQTEAGEFPGPYKPEPVPGARRAAVNTSHVGQTAIALYTLRACGVPADDPQVKSGFEFLRGMYRRFKGDPRGLDNYGVSLTVLALETHYPPPAPPDDDATRYGRTVQPPPAIPEPDLSWMKELTAWLVAAQSGGGGFSYRSPGSGGYDHSNSQYSLLALKAARRCGIEVPARVWEKALRHFLQAQERKGPDVVRKERAGGGGQGYGPVTRAAARDHARGWGYMERDPATGSMTTGGVSSVAICRSELRGKGVLDPADDVRALQAIWDGLAWLGLHFTVKENPGPDNAPMSRESWHFYYLYGLERAGVLSGATLMGDHDWYREGAEYLVATQEGSGGWRDGGGEAPPVPGVQRVDRPALDEGEMLDTCFALLFLKRATERLGRGTATAAAEDSLDLSGAPALDEKGFRDLFDLVFRRFAAARDADPEARAADFVKMGTRSIPLLVMKLDDPDAAVRAAAIAALRDTTGISQGFDPAAPDAARAAAVKAWQEWWFAGKATLVADPEAGRFVEKPR